jgi:glycosyltransferase involved in cell wall biosynthesis
MDKNLVIVLTMLPHHGGKYQYSLSVLNSFRDQSHFKIVVLYYDGHWDNIIPKEFLKIKVNKDIKVITGIKLLIGLIPFGDTLIRLVSNKFFSIHKKIHDIKPDLVIYPGGETLSYENKYNSVVPVFDIMHKYESYPEINSFAVNYTRNLHYKRVVNNASIVFVDSEVGKKQLEESYPCKRSLKIFKLPYVAPPYVYNSKDFSSELELPKKYLFYPAQFWEHKNHKNLIQALELIKTKHNKIVDLVLVGAKKNYYSNVLDVIKQYDLENQIHYFDYVQNDELVYLYKNAFALIMPSYLGPTNIPPLEAIALGCPVIVSDVYAAREQLDDSALYFNPKDSEDISNKILTLLENKKLREDIIRKGFIKSSQYSQSQFRSTLLNSVINY